MAKLSITRLFEVSRFMSTEAGQQLHDLIVYLSDFAEQTLRALRNGLTFGDNFNCEIVTATLQHEVPQAISAKAKPILIFANAVSSTTAVTGLVNYVNSQGNLIVTPTFKGAPTGQISVVLVLVYQ